MKFCSFFEILLNNQNKRNKQRLITNDEQSYIKSIIQTDLFKCQSCEKSFNSFTNITVEENSFKIYNNGEL